MENELYNFVIDLRDGGHCVTGGMIRAEALRILHGTNFQASNGWLSGFLRRKRLCMRRITTIGRDLPPDASESANTFLAECGEEYMGDGFDRDTLLNGDETSFYIDPPTTQTYAPIGTRRVEAVTTGQQKTRVSVCFTGTAGGTKIKPLILIPRKNPLKNWIPPNNVQVVYGTNGCFNEIVVSQHYIPLLVEYKNNKHYSALNMIYDQAPCHQTQRVQTNFVNASIRVKRCPKRMTPLFQPADVCWMSPVKSGYFKRWNHWLIHAPKAYTASGNRKSPGYAQVIT